METGSREHKILLSGGIMILIMLSLFGNILVCCAVYYSRNLRARVNYLIVSLAVSDILIAVLAMPLWMAFEMNHYMHLSPNASEKLMRFWEFIDILGGIASIANLVAISYERLWSVVSPLKHRRYLTNITLGCIITAVWIYAIFVAATTLFLNTWKFVILYNSVVGFFFPLFLIFTAYTIIFIIVNRSPRSIVSAHDNYKINITIAIIIGLFILCWAPHFIFSVLHVHCESCYDHLVDRLWYRSLSKWLHYANSCVNPLVYGIANAQYKEAFKSVFKKMCLCCLFKKQNSTPSPQALPIYYPGNNPSIDSDKLRVEVSPENKEIRGANGYTKPAVEVDDMYLPGDYRALPRFSPQFSLPRTERLHSETTTTTTTETFNTSLIDSTFLEDEESLMNLRAALLNPASLSRTSNL